ncbi:hypothetical protein HPT27_07630 [Permianibacter sp. IMCC34836]|uniref:VanZ family protein n=1 Tax=Permianibacter fluminis TaxID=2738515 RepID=UPI001555E3D8|nr:VanZ family protein [Permianibacter fluminis]NQD36894.1 hypothetical protein [Permianibacter fluminis]
MSSARPELRRLLYVLTLLIVYVSLYPFRFRVEPIPFEPAWSAVDMLANVLLFLPFGLLARWLAGPGHDASHATRNRLALLLLAGAALAAVLQWLQVFVPSRQPSLMDVGMNWIGLGLGAGLAPWLSPTRWQHLGRFWLDSRAGLLVLCWLAAQLSPYLPGNPLRAIERQLFLWQQLQWQFELLAAHTLAWLIVLRLLRPALAPWRLGALIAVCVLLQPWLMGNGLLREELLAPLAAGLLHALGLRSLRLLLWLTVLMVLTKALSPWHPMTVAQPFRWLPFGGLVNAPVPFALATLAEKAFWLGCLYELGLRIGWRERRWLVLLLLLLVALEFGQRWLPGHRAELTDPLLLLLMVLLLRTAAATPPAEASRVTAANADTLARVSAKAD